MLSHLWGHIGLILLLPPRIFVPWLGKNTLTNKALWGTFSYKHCKIDSECSPKDDISEK